MDGNGLTLCTLAICLFKIVKVKLLCNLAWFYLVEFHSKINIIETNYFISAFCLVYYTVIIFKESIRVDEENSIKV